MTQELFKIPAGIQIIGICGKAGAGKDTICDMISERYDKIYKQAFAAPLKRTASAAFGIPLEHFHQSEIKEMVNPFWGVSPRKIAQFMGTEMFRNTVGDLIPEVGSNFWAMKMAGRLSGELLLDGEGEYEPGDTVIIPDVRFPNEEEFIKVNRGVLIQVVRPGLGEVGIRGHASETFVLNSTYIINNDEGLDKLKRVVYDICSGLVADHNFKFERKLHGLNASDF